MSTARMDFETYSEAGYIYDKDLQFWRSIVGKQKGGLSAVGAPVYAEHPSTEVLSLAYDLEDGHGPRLWVPGCPLPQDLFAYMAAGGLIEAWNSAFEFYIWHYVCHSRMGWPPLPYQQLRCSMARSRAFSLPGKLEKAAAALGTADQKIADGTRLVKKFAKPRKPTKTDSRLRIRPSEDPEDAVKLYNYNIGDIRAERAVSVRTPQLYPKHELDLWLTDQGINFRGVYIDQASLAGCISIVEQATVKYAAEFVALTGGAVETVGQVAKISKWLASEYGIQLPSLDADTVALALTWDLPAAARRVLEIRASLGSSSVKKLFAIERRLSSDGRLRDLFAFCGADTGRFAGRGPQPQNLKVPRADWTVDNVETALALIRTGSLEAVEAAYGDAIAAVADSLRGLFCAAPGHDLICSDYSAIEAVVLAMLAGEQWRIDVFNTHGKLYETTAAKITGTPLQEILDHEIRTGEYHPLRKFGKVPELALGYQGGVDAMKVFGADKYFNSDEEIQQAVWKWRAESPAIAGLWGYLPNGKWGQIERGFWGELEDAAQAAVQFPGQAYPVNTISYVVHNNVLQCSLPSGRILYYHQPLLTPGFYTNTKGEAVPTVKLSYMRWDSKYQKWMRTETYGGKLCENIVQAVARDILTHAMPKLEAAGYPLVLHVHDEPMSEVAAGWGSVEEYERIMVDLPPWAADWPIKATGGWRGHRYRKG